MFLEQGCGDGFPAVPHGRAPNVAPCRYLGTYTSM